LPEAAVALFTTVHADRVLHRADVDPADQSQARMLARLRGTGCVHPVADGWGLTDRGHEALSDYADAEAFRQ
jgi:hypothetical protein